jgi:hypothetical protein
MTCQTGQLPEPGEVFLDHVAHFVPAMAAAAAAMERCGFRLTPYSVQANAGADGGLVPSGTANRCAMLRRGYLEILERVSDTPLSRQLAAQVGLYTGIHLAAFSVTDADAERSRLAAAGFAPLDPVRLRRPTGRPDRPHEEARFTVLRVPPEAMPEGRLQFLTHHTEEAVWAPADLEHPNGAISLEAIHIAVAEPEAAAARYARFLGRPAMRAGGAHVIATERGRVVLHGPDGAPFAPARVTPEMVAYEVGSADIGATRRFLAEHGIEASPARTDAVAARLPLALGGTILFRAAGAT